MLLFLLLPILLCSGHVFGAFGPYAQDSGFVDVRPGAHMFYWLFYTTAEVDHYTERPLIIWLQGGPGGSSTGYGNFELLGPLDLSLKDREHSWVKNFNVLFLDNPVGAGFSYVDTLNLLTTTNLEIAEDFLNFMKAFYEKHEEFEEVPLYIYGQSYGGKMAIDIGIKLHEATEEGTIRSNLKGIGMGNAWISPVDSTLTWAPLLLAAGLVDNAGYEAIQVAARRAEQSFNDGQYVQSTNYWAATQQQVFARTGGVDFYNILTKWPVRGFRADALNATDAYELAKHMMISNRPYGMVRDNIREGEEYDLYNLMNGPVKEGLGIPDNVVWDSQSSATFNAQNGDFMKPVTLEIEKLLRETNIILTKYNGNLDLICDTPGQILWVDRLNWDGAEGYRNAPKNPIWVDDKLEGYYKSYGNFRFFWINVAGHSVPRDNPAGTTAFLRDMTNFG